MAHQTCWFGKPYVIIVFLLPVLANGLLNMTIAVVNSEQTTHADTKHESYVSLDNGSCYVTVLWNHLDSRHPFQITQFLQNLAEKKVDILIWPDEMNQTLQDVPTAIQGLPQIVSYIHENNDHAQNKSLCDSGTDHHWPNNAQDLDMEECQGQQGSKIKIMDTLAPILDQTFWEQFVVLFDQSQELIVKELSDKLTDFGSNIQLLAYSLDDIIEQEGEGSGSGSEKGSGSSSVEERPLHRLIHTLYDKRDEELRVLLLCSLECATQVLTEASQFDGLNDKKTAMAMISRWLLVLPPHDHHVLESCDLQLDNIVVIGYPPVTLRPSIRNINKEVEEIIYSAFSQLTETNSTPSVQLVAQAITQSLQESKSCHRSYVKTLLWKPEGRRLGDVGYIGQDKQLYMGKDQELFPNIKFGLNNRVFRIATLPWPSFVERKGNGLYEGLCIDLLRQLQRALNFSYEWTEPEDQEWGSLNENNTWTGLVGLLERKEVDMVMAPISVQAAREQVMDFTHPFYIDYTTVLLKLPDPADSKWKRLIQPFQPHVHMFIWISLLSVTVITFVLELVNPFYLTNTKTMLHIGDMFWYMFGALLTQGGARLPDSQTGRTMVSAFWLFSIVMAATYSGNLIAFLTVSIDSPPFDSLEGMVDQDQYIWGTIGGTFFMTLFEKSQLTVFRKIWQGLERERHSDPDVISGDPERHLMKVKGGDYAYIGDKSAISTWLKTECDLITIKEEFLPMQYAVGLINNSAYTNMFSDILMKINEIGLTETWIRKWWGKTSFCKGTLTASATPIELIDVQSAFFLIFIGITFSLLILALEKLVHRFHLVHRIKRVFIKKKNPPRETTPAWNSSWITFDGVTVRQISADNQPERRAGSGSYPRNMFYLETPKLGGLRSNGGVENIYLNNDEGEGMSVHYLSSRTNRLRSNKHTADHNHSDNDDKETESYCPIGPNCVTDTCTSETRYSRNNAGFQNDSSEFMDKKDTSRATASDSQNVTNNSRKRFGFSRNFTDNFVNGADYSRYGTGDSKNVGVDSNNSNATSRRVASDSTHPNSDSRNVT